MIIFALKDTQAQVVKNLLVFQDEDMAKNAMRELLYDKYSINKIQLNYKHLELYKVGAMSDVTMEIEPKLEFVCAIGSLVDSAQCDYLDIVSNHFYAFGTKNEVIKDDECCD